MSKTVSNKEHWRELYRRQRLKNVHVWLEELERTSDPAALATANYDKLLQAIEQTLNHEDSFSVGCDLLREITPIAFDMTDWGRLHIYLKGALSKSQRLPSRSSVAYLHEWIADIESGLTKYSEAEENFQRALQLYLEEGETARYGRILPRLARVYVSQGQMSKALELCKNALSLGEKSNDPIVIADAYFGLAEINIRANDWQEALKFSNRAISNYEEIGEQRFIFKTRVLSVTCKVSLKRYDEAKAEADGLLKEFESAENAYDNVYHSIHLRRALGFMAFEQKDYIAAENHWQEAYRQNTLVGAPDMTASICNNLGMVYTILEEYEAAEDMLNEALTNYEQLGDIYRWANCMDNLVDLYEKMGDWAACRRTLEQTIAKLEPEATMAHSRELLQDMQQRLEKLPNN